MGTEAIVLLPGLIAAWVAMTRSLEQALLAVYLPVLMLIPDYFRMPVPSFPDPGFGQATILPIGLGLLYVAFLKGGWKFSALDYYVLAFLTWQFISNDYNLGYKEAQNNLFDELTLALFPYMAGKALLERANMRVLFAKRFVFLLFVVTVVSLYEFRMGDNLFRPVVLPLFPGQDPGAFTQMRWGFGRIAGPYVHAIFMCAILGIGYILCRWLTAANLWEPRFRWLGGIPWKKASIISAALLFGMFMTLSRGPWIGCAVGVALAAVGTKANRSKALMRTLLILVGGGAAVFLGGKAYLDGASAFEGVEDQASAQYRAVLLDEYDKIVMQSPIFGWGHVNWPRVPGMPSIDNNYLYTALGSGLVGTGLLALMLAVCIWRTFAAGYFPKNLDPKERSFRFTMMGIILATTISTGTCYLAAQLYPLMFLFLGWAEASVLKRPAKVTVSEVANSPAVADIRLMRVVA